ncbi:MAG: hypothetical protein IIA45_10320 [Bacteroidetes bacterium]|nr:hypothetical protein [Bacteroidota bacterium]
MLVIIGPNRKTLVDASHGSGKFTLSESGESKSYTTKTIVNYNNKSQHLCINWEQTDPFTAGNYKIEIYGSGYLMGISTMRLK